MFKISDGLNIQFWKDGELTYTEEISNGVNENIDGYCFRQKFKCNVPAKIQFITDQNADFYLDIYENDIFIKSILFETEGAFDPEGTLKYLDFVAADHELCDKDLKLIITMPAIDPIHITNDGSESEDFDEKFTEIDTGKGTWVIDETYMTMTIPEGQTESNEVVVSGLTAGNNKYLNLKFDVVLVKDEEFVERNGAFKLIIDFYNLSDVLVDSIEYVNDVGNTVTQAFPDNYYIVSLPLSGVGFNKIKMRGALILPSEVDGALMHINVFVIPGWRIVQAYTDIVEFRSSILGAIDIYYKGLVNYAGIVYNEDSEYSILTVQGRFFHQEGPTTQKTSELSEGNEIALSSSKRLQKLLEIENCAYYFHNKIQIALLHCVVGSVLINGVPWTYGEGYKLKENVDTNPLKGATVLLTRQNYVLRNAL